VKVSVLPTGDQAPFVSSSLIVFNGANPEPLRFTTQIPWLV
jgi:hypothetical protein